MKESDASLFNTIVSDEQEKGDDVVTTLQMNNINFQSMGIPETTSQQSENNGKEKMNAMTVLSSDYLEKDIEGSELPASLIDEYPDATDNPVLKFDDSGLFLEENTESDQNTIDENTTGFLELDEFIGNSTRQSR